MSQYKKIRHVGGTKVTHPRIVGIGKIQSVQNFPPSPMCKSGQRCVVIYKRTDYEEIVETDSALLTPEPA